MHGQAQLIFKISGYTWLVWGQIMLGSAAVLKTKLESSCYFSPQFIFAIPVKIIAVLAKVNSWVWHNQYINNIHHLHGIKPLQHKILLRLHFKEKIKGLYGKGSRKSAGVLLLPWVHVDNDISVCSSDAVSFLLVLEPNTPEKSVITALCIGHLQKAIWAVLPGVRKHNVPFTAGEMKAGSSN